MPSAPTTTATWDCCFSSRGAVCATACVVRRMRPRRPSPYRAHSPSSSRALSPSSSGALGPSSFRERRSSSFLLSRRRSHARAPLRSLTSRPVLAALAALCLAGCPAASDRPADGEPGVVLGEVVENDGSPAGPASDGAGPGVAGSPESTVGGGDSSPGAAPGEGESLTGEPPAGSNPGEPGPIAPQPSTPQPPSVSCPDIVVDTREGQAVTILLTASAVNLSSVLFAVTSPPPVGALGPVAPLGSFSASVVYAAPTGFTGAAQFRYVAFAPGGEPISAEATVTVKVAAAQSANAPPAIVPPGPLSKMVEKNSKAVLPANQFTVKALDPDAAPGSLAWSVASGAGHGTAAIAGGSPSSPGGEVTVSYEPQPEYVGDDAFTVKVADAGGASATLLVNVTVAEPPPGKVYYVDGPNPAAGDTNPGSEALPFKTIQKAANVVAPNDTVYVKAGVYKEMVWIKQSGTPAAPITFRNYGNDVVIVDGENLRSWCVMIGENKPTHTAGHYIVLDGFRCRNPRGVGFAGADSNSAAILVLGTRGVVVRRCRAWRDDFPGYPNAFVPPDYRSKGIFVNGWNEDTVVEYCDVRYMAGGALGTRIDNGDVGGFPVRPVLRWNHVSWCNVSDPVLQNYAGGMGFGTATVDGVAEYNLVHHVGDQGVGTDDSGGHILRYNIAYRMNHALSSGGGGDGVKTKPMIGMTKGDVIHHNVSFLNAGPGYNVNVIADGVGAKIYNNLAYGNGAKGITASVFTSGPAVTEIKNNVSVANEQKDIKYPTTVSGVFDFNFIEDGDYSPLYAPHTLTGAYAFANVALLAVDANGDGTPDVLDPLNDPNAFPTTEAAIEYARAKVKQIFGPVAASPGVDAGVDVGLNKPDLFGVGPLDFSGKANPWSGVPGTGVVDMGPIEFTP